MITNRPRNCGLAIVSWTAKEEGENITHIMTVAYVTEFCCNYATRIVHVTLSKSYLYLSSKCCFYLYPQTWFVNCLKFLTLRYNMTMHNIVAKWENSEPLARKHYTSRWQGNAHFSTETRNSHHGLLETTSEVTGIDMTGIDVTPIEPCRVQDLYYWTLCLVFSI